MKLHGREILPENKIIVLPRKNGPDLDFHFKTILDTKEFDKICPTPQPPSILHKGETQTRPDVENKQFLKELDIWGTKKADWMFLESISATPDLEFETVDRHDPKTWANWRIEMREAGITDAEQGHLMNTMIQAQGLDQHKIDQATENFLAAQAALQKE